MSEVTSLYLHGLGRADLRVGEQVLLANHVRCGIDVRVAEIDWESEEKFTNLLDRVTLSALLLLSKMKQEDILVLEGSSAGGSLAFNVAHQIDDNRIRVISHSGRLAVGDYEPGSYRSLEHCARLGTDGASQSYYDSVSYLQAITILKMEQEKAYMGRSYITKPWADWRVPVSTMTINGIRVSTMPVIGHAPGIGAGILLTPHIVEEHLAKIRLTRS